MPRLRPKNETAPPQLPARTTGQLSIRAPARRHPAERRNLASREELLRRIETEYGEMPGLRLTEAQAQRLFGLRKDVCVRVLNALVEAAVLQRDQNGAFVRAGGPM